MYRGVKLFGLSEGIVMQVCDEFLIVLVNDGSFVRVKKYKREVLEGESIWFSKYDIYDRKRIIDFPKLQVVLIAFIAFVLFIPEIYSHDTYAHVSLDNKTSMEFILSKDMKILNIIPYNEKAKRQLQDLKEWKYEDFDVVVDQVLKLSKKEGYLNKNEEVLIATSIHGKSNNFKKQNTEKRLESELRILEKENSINIVSIEVSCEVLKKAEEQNMSLGRYGILIHSGVTRKNDLGRNLEEYNKQDINERDLLNGEINDIDNIHITESTYDDWIMKNR